MRAKRGSIATSSSEDAQNYAFSKRLKARCACAVWAQSLSPIRSRLSAYPTMSRLALKARRTGGSRATAFVVRRHHQKCPATTRLTEARLAGQCG